MANVTAKTSSNIFYNSYRKYPFIEQLLKPDILADMKKSLPFQSSRNGVETEEDERIE